MALNPDVAQQPIAQQPVRIRYTAPSQFPAAIIGSRTWLCCKAISIGAVLGEPTVEPVGQVDGEAGS